LPRPCVNKGGAQSLIRLPQVPVLEQAVVLPPQARTALECWQARAGQVITVADPQGGFYRARVLELRPQMRIVPFSRFSNPVESPLALEVYQALPAKERFELVLEKLTEIGVRRIVPYTSRRSATLAERDAGQRKSHRWPQVLCRASSQCRRGIIPELAPVLSWEEALAEAADADCRLLLYEGPSPQRMGEAIGARRPSRLALLIGPEGGFDPAEVVAAETAGFLSVGLGPRILRTETAAIVAAALAQYALGDFG
jgi:16S rRNA (uracil1498-N3)-methyltransferase